MRCSATVVLPEPAVPRITTKPARRARDELELVGIDEPGDVGQMLVGAPARRRAGRRRGGVGSPSPTSWARSAAPSPPARRGGSRSRCASRPRRAGSTRNDALGRLDAPQRRDRGWSPCAAPRPRRCAGGRRSPPRTPRPAGSGRRCARSARCASRRSARRAGCASPCRAGCRARVPFSRSRRWAK